MSADEDPRYEVYGSDTGGSWLGMRCNKFRLVGVAASITIDNETWCQYVVMPNGLVSSDLGFGPAWWVTGIDSRDGTTWVEGSEDVGFAVTELQGLGAGDKDTFRYRTVHAGSKYSIGFTGAYPSCPTYIKEMANKQLSIAFQRPIYLCEGSFPLYKFLDTGEVTIRYGFVKNGKEYEGTNAVPGTGNGNCGVFNSPVGYIKMKLMRGSDVEEEFNIVTLNEKTIYSKTFNVKAGDEIVTQIGRLSSSGGQGGNYMVFYFDNDLVGWEKNAP